MAAAMNYRRLRLCFVIAMFADVAMALASVPMVIICVMNVGLYFALVPMPVSRKELRDLLRK
jgi:hypothetical protein